MLNDVRFAVRILRKSPAFLLTAVLSLALGIGASTTMFSAFRAVFLTPLPYFEPDRLIEIGKTGADGRPIYVSEADVRFFRQFSQSFQSFGTYAFYRAVALSGGGEPTNLVTRIVESDLFHTLGTHPLLGRVFAAADFQNANPRTVLLSYKCWRKHFAGDVRAIGRTVMLDNESHTVIGVMPERFQFPSATNDAWVPDRTVVTDAIGLNRNLIARLKPGFTASQALAELERLRPALIQSYPESRRNWTFKTEILSERDAKKYRTAFNMLCGAVALLALIACLNVANLVIARSVSREGEFAVRNALGAGRMRLVRQVMLESLVLAAVGGTLGALLAWMGNRALVAWIPAHYQIARLGETRTDFAVLGFAMAATTGTALLFGIGPALVLSRFSLREMGRTTTQSMSRIRWRGALVVAEVALSLTLMIGSGLLMRSFVTLANVDPGFRPDHVLTAMIPASNQLSKDKPALIRRLSDILERSQRIPGVTAAGLATAIPMGTIEITVSFATAERPHEESYVNLRAVSAGYFPALGMVLRRGRFFTPQDNETGPAVALVNESLARRFWPGLDPLGQRLSGTNGATVVGVVADTHSQNLSGPPKPELFRPYRQLLGPALGATVVLRTNGDPEKLAAAFRKTIHESYPNQPVTELSTMESRLSDSMAEPRLYAALLGLFAGIALLLTAIGIYGVVSYSVSHRIREFGIRMALGARRADVLRFVMRNGLSLILIGVAAGTAMAWSLSKYIASLLFGVTERDTAAFVLGPLVLIAIATVACYLPARRATRIDPNKALRQE